MIGIGDRMLKRCGLKKARDSENGCVYAGLINQSGEVIDAVLEIRSDSPWNGRYTAILRDQFAVDDDMYIGFTPREARAVAVRIREMERERKKTIRKRLRAEAKKRRTIRRIFVRAAKRRTK